MSNKTNPNNKATSSKYADLLQKSQADLELQEQQFKVESAKLQLQSDILATQKSIATAEQNYLKTLVQSPFNSKAIIAAKSEITSAKLGLEALQELQQELF